MRYEGGGRGGFRSYGGRDDERENRNVRSDNFGTRGFRPFSSDRGGSRNYNNDYRGGGRGGGFRSDDDRGYRSYTNPTPRYRDNVKPAVNNDGNNAVNTERSNVGNNAGRNAKNPYRRPPRNTYKRSVRFDSPREGKALKKSENGNDAGEDLFNANEGSYTALPPEKLPKNLHTVKISGLPRKLSEKGLYNFAKCFGVVVNIYEIPDDALIKTSETAIQNPEEQQNESVASNNEVPKQKDGEVSKPEGDVVPSVDENVAAKLSENQAPEAEEKKVSKSEEKKAEDQNVPLKKSDDVVNDAENVPKGEENLNEKPAVSESGYYSALISFARSGSAYSMKRLNGTNAFGSQITVEYDNKDRRGSNGKASASKNSSSSEKIVRRKEIGIFRLSNDIMKKVFGFLDFSSRIKAEGVCRRWQSIMFKVKDSLPPADDKPKNIAVSVAFGPPEMKESRLIKLDKANGALTVTINEKRRRADFLRNVLTKILSSVSGEVMEINISGEMLIDQPIFELLGKYCNKNCTYTFEKVFLRNMSLAYINGFIRQCDSRLKIVPECQFP